MIAVWRHIAETVATHGAGAMVSIAALSGSTPRELGARLVVRPDGAFWGTIGGGALEWSALAEARMALSAGRGPARFVERPLGPDLGQCCGGRVTLLIETFDGRDRADLARLAGEEAEGPFAVQAIIAPGQRVDRQILAPAAIAAGPPMVVGVGRARGRPPQGSRIVERFGDDRQKLLLFGAGHVGRALALALAPLPFLLRWVDPRPDGFPAHVPANAAPIIAADPAAEALAAAAGSMVMVMTHSHALDLAIVHAALKRDDFSGVGLIGSATKRARFLRRLHEAGLAPQALARLVCPIGVPGIAGKEPAVIAAGVAAQLLQWRERAAAMGAQPCKPLQQAGGRQ